MTLATALMACSRAPESGKNSADQPAVPVSVVPATIRSIPVTVRASGTVQSPASVEVRSQVDGRIDRVLFNEGDTVKAGQGLFQIDPRPYAIRLQAAEAALRHDQALLANADSIEKHNRDLRAKRFVSQEAYLQAKTNLEALEATIAQDRATIANSRLDLEYATITAPMAGRAGRLLVHAGNLVRANEATVLVTLHQTDPIHVSFAVAQRWLRDILSAQQSGRLLPVTIMDSSHDSGALNGTVSFIDNAVDQTTGTIMLKATLANAQNRLWPGQFVDVVVTLREAPQGVVVPTNAVQLGPWGQYVYVVTAGDKVEPRAVSVKVETDGQSLLGTGLTAGERVVTDGHVRLTPGAHIKVVDAKPPS